MHTTPHRRVRVHIKLRIAGPDCAEVMRETAMEAVTVPVVTASATATVNATTTATATVTASASASAAAGGA